MCAHSFPTGKQTKFKMVDHAEAADAVLTGTGQLWIKGHYSLNPRDRARSRKGLEEKPPVSFPAQCRTYVPPNLEGAYFCTSLSIPELSIRSVVACQWEHALQGIRHRCSIIKPAERDTAG